MVRVRCGELLREPGAAERLANIWGSGAGLVLEETHAAMGRLLKVIYFTFGGVTILHLPVGLRIILLKPSLPIVPCLSRKLRQDQGFELS